MTAERGHHRKRPLEGYIMVRVGFIKLKVAVNIRVMVKVKVRADISQSLLRFISRLRSFNTWDGQSMNDGL